MLPSSVSPDYIFPLRRVSAGIVKSRKRKGKRLNVVNVAHEQHIKKIKFKRTNAEENKAF